MLLREPTNLPLYRLIENFKFLVHKNISQIYKTLSCNIVFYAQNRSANGFCGFESNKKGYAKTVMYGSHKMLNLISNHPKKWSQSYKMHRKAKTKGISVWSLTDI